MISQLNYSPKFNYLQMTPLCICMAVANETDAAIVQKDLKLLEEWENRSQMSFHLDKCYVL